MTNFLKTAFNFGEYWKSGTKNVKLQTETDNKTEKPMFSMQTPKPNPKTLPRPQASNPKPPSSYPSQ